MHTLRQKTSDRGRFVSTCLALVAGAAVARHVLTNRPRSLVRPHPAPLCPAGRRPVLPHLAPVCQAPPRPAPVCPAPARLAPPRPSRALGRAALALPSSNGGAVKARLECPEGVGSPLRCCRLLLVLATEAAGFALVHPDRELPVASERR